MTTKELQSRVRVASVGCGSFCVTITYKGQKYGCRSNNSLAYDRLTADVSPLTVLYSYTLKQALRAFYDECRRKKRLT